MMNNNYLLTEMNRWTKECLVFLISDGMSPEEKTKVRMSILTLTHKELGKRVKEIRELQTQEPTKTSHKN